VNHPLPVQINQTIHNLTENRSRLRFRESLPFQRTARIFKHQIRRSRILPIQHFDQTNDIWMIQSPHIPNFALESGYFIQMNCFGSHLLSSVKVDREMDIRARSATKSACKDVLVEFSLGFGFVVADLKRFEPKAARRSETQHLRESFASELPLTEIE
jgi:hypothetical protein